MSMATKMDTQSPALQVADSHDLIRVHGARVNNLKGRQPSSSPKRRLTVFTGVSGSGKSSLVFGTIAAESQRLINETYSAFVQGFMPTLARPEVDVLEGLTTAIIVDQERMVPTPAPPSAPPPTPTRCCASSSASWGNHTSARPARTPSTSPRSKRAVRSRSSAAPRPKTEKATFTRTGGMCTRCEGRGSVTDFDLTALYDDSKSINEGAITIPGYSMDGWYGRIFRGCGFFDPDKPIRKYNKRELHDLLTRSRPRSRSTGST